MRPAFSVVIPAHDEEAVISRCLAFVAHLDPGEAEVVVVANGCSDGTASAAAAIPDVRVIELEEAGKTTALNAGDSAVAAFPRVYLDADVSVSALALRSVRDAVAGDKARVCAPSVELLTEGRPWSVRAFYRAYRALPYVQNGLTGLGLYAISEAGRRRFEEFPNVMADDLFVQRLFDPAERVVLTNCSFVVQTPRTLRSLTAVRARIARANAQLAAHDEGQSATGSETARALIRLVIGNPRLLAAACVYAGVTFVARTRARLAPGSDWIRDFTTR